MFIAFALLILWAVVELFVAITVAHAIGALDTVLLLTVSCPIGIWAMRSQGRVVWRRLTAAVASGRPPAQEVLDGALVLIGGLLLIVPGFIGDLVGALLLIVLSRGIVRRLLMRAFRGRMAMRAARFTRRQSAYDVDATATDAEQPRLGQ
jgi:UPF0716 protein FxsA